MHEDRVQDEEKGKEPVVKATDTSGTEDAGSNPAAVLDRVV
jgi:hypothetical protein